LSKKSLFSNAFWHKEAVKKSTVTDV